MSKARQQSATRNEMRMASGQKSKPRINNNRKSLGEQFRQTINGKVITHYTSSALKRKKAFVKQVHGIEN